MAESAADRYDREWLQLQDDRKVRGFDARSEERRNRDFSDDPNPDNNTVVDTYDNVPAGFVQQDFEDSLIYLPDRDA